MVLPELGRENDATGVAPYVVRAPKSQMKDEISSCFVRDLGILTANPVLLALLASSRHCSGSEVFVGKIEEGVTRFIPFLCKITSLAVLCCRINVFLVSSFMRVLRYGRSSKELFSTLTLDARFVSPCSWSCAYNNFVCFLFILCP